MKVDFWVEQCLHALFECQEDVNEITKNHVKAVSVKVGNLYCSIAPQMEHSFSFLNFYMKVSSP